MSAKQGLQSAAAVSEQRERPRHRGARPRQFFQASRGVVAAAATAGEPLLTLAEVRDRLGFRTTSAVYKLIYRHKLPTRLVGRRYRVAPSELDAWTKGGR